MARLILHAGFHKTGTSAIQQSSARNRRRLKAGGILYPRLWPATFRPVTGHHFIVHAVAGKDGPIGPEQVQRLLRSWHRRAVNDGCAVLLSSEAICRYMPLSAAESDGQAMEFCVKLKALLTDFEVRPVLVIRRQDNFVRSLYQEHVAAGTGASARSSFSDYLSGAAADKARFLERLRVFRETFGSVKVLVYEELAGETLPAAFFRALGVEGLGRCEARAVRPSLSVGETLVKQQLNRWIRSRHQNRLALYWLRSRRVQRIIEGELGHCTTLWPDATTRSAFIDRFEDENARIVREFLGRDGRLFPPFDDNVAAQVSPPDAARVADVLRQAATATHWWLQAIIGRKAVSELMQGQGAA